MLRILAEECPKTNLDFTEQLANASLGGGIALAVFILAVAAVAIAFIVAG